MKNQFHKIIAAIAVLLVVITTSGYAQVVTPATTGVKFFCHDAGNYDLGNPPNVGANSRWVVRYNSADTLAPEEIGAVMPIELTGNSILAADLVTGYLHISVISDVSCESEPEVIPIYKFAQLTASITGADDYCEGSPSEFTATPTSSDAHQTFAYQWYTVNESDVATAIPGATSSTYTPTGLLAGNTTNYKVRIGYLVGSDKYCGHLSTVEEVTVTAKPSKPTITVSGVSGEGW